MPKLPAQTDGPDASKATAETAGPLGKPPDTEIEPLGLKGRAAFLIFGVPVAAFGWSTARFGLAGFATGEVAMVSLQRNSAFRVYSYALALLLMGAGPLCFGAAMVLRPFTPIRYINALWPILAGAFAAWLIAIPLAAMVLACNLIAPLFPAAD